MTITNVLNVEMKDSLNEQNNRSYPLFKKVLGWVVGIGGLYVIAAAITHFLGGSDWFGGVEVLTIVLVVFLIFFGWIRLLGWLFDA